MLLAKIILALTCWTLFLAFWCWFFTGAKR